MTRTETFTLLYDHCRRMLDSRHKPLRVAVNGMEGAGKTVFAAAFTDYLHQHGQAALHVSIDGFHHPKAHRYRQGRDSAQGYYEDSYNEEAFVDKVLLASQGEEPCIVSAVHDLETDEPVQAQPVALDSRTVLVTDGAYLFKPACLKHWDLKIYLKTSFETALERGVRRDAELLGGEAVARQKYQDRYHAASRMYLEQIQPETLADFILDNTGFDCLRLLKRPGN